MQRQIRFSPLARRSLDTAADQVIKACKKAFGNNLVCVTLKGSSVKGDFIPGYSDFDFHVFIKPEAMDGERTPKAGPAIEFQRAFGNVNPEDFGVSQFQIYFINSESYPSDWSPPVKGASRVLWGRLPPCLTKASKETTKRLASEHLAGIAEARKAIVTRFVDKPDTRIADVVRLLGTTLKGYAYSALVLMHENPKQAFSLDLNDMIHVLENSIGSVHFGNFFSHVNDWNKVRNDPEKARAAFAEGLEAFEDVESWYKEQSDAQPE